MDDVNDKIEANEIDPKSNNEKKSDTADDKGLDFDLSVLDETIKSHIGYSMVAGAIPFPLVDIAAVTTIQLDMLSRLGQKYKIDFDKERAKMFLSSILGASIGSVLGRLGASVAKVVPGIGTVLGVGAQVALAGASTFAIGKMFEKYFKEGKDLTDLDLESDFLKAEFDKLFEKGRSFVDQLNPIKDDDHLKKLEILNEMKEKSLINDEEYEKTKAEILKKMS